MIERLRGQIRLPPAAGCQQGDMKFGECFAGKEWGLRKERALQTLTVWDRIVTRRLGKTVRLLVKAAREGGCLRSAVGRTAEDGESDE